MKKEISYGIIFCAYNEEKYVKDSLNIFCKLKEKFNFFISVSSVPFAEYQDTSFKNFEDGTVKIVKEFESNKKIDIAYFEPRNLYEFQARNLCLSHCLALGCDYVWIVDADEVYTEEEIENIIKFVNKNELIDYFKINFKNYIFDGKSWINETYLPRIFKTNSAGGISGFYHDNDIKYKDGRIYKELSEMKIPKDIAFVKHFSWTNDKGKRKVEYQMKHFGCCSYTWNEEKQTLEFNNEYYKKMNESLPKVNKD